MAREASNGGASHWDPQTNEVEAVGPDGGAFCVPVRRFWRTARESWLARRRLKRVFSDSRLVGRRGSSSVQALRDEQSYQSIYVNCFSISLTLDSA